MKKKRNWATIAAVAAGTLAYFKFAKVAAEPEEKKPEETGKEACIRWYGNLTWAQYAEKLRLLDVQYELAQEDPDNPPFLDRAIYEGRRSRLIYCRNQQKVPGL